MRLDVEEKMSAQGAGPFVSSSEQFLTLMRDETARYAKVIEVATIKLGD